MPILADKGVYIASESTFYRVLRKHDIQHHHGRSAEAAHRPISTHYATAPNQVSMWDITYLNGPVKGKHYYLYLISDLFSRKIVGWEVWPEETAEHTSELIRRAIISKKIAPPRVQPLVLYSDNGSPMKGATMLETLYRLEIPPSNSRPRVSNDNPYAGSLFKTLKYLCNYQPKGFATITEARLWCKQFENWYNNEHHHTSVIVDKVIPFWRYVTDFINWLRQSDQSVEQKKLEIGRFLINYGSTLKRKILQFKTRFLMKLHHKNI